ESAGDGTYTITDAERGHHGTTVTLHLKPADAERGMKDYTDEHVLADIVKRYSDFVGYPIRMKRWKSGDDKAQVIEDDTLNSMKAIWDRAKNEVTEQEYKDFYRHLTHDWTDPLRTVPVKM